MGDYISRKALLEYVETLEGSSENKVYEKGMNVVLRGFLPQIVNDVPDADVQEVKHAKWNISCDRYYPYCSNCKKEPQGREMTAWCPNCGARMDLEE